MVIKLGPAIFEDHISIELLLYYFMLASSFLECLVNSRDIIMGNRPVWGQLPTHHDAWEHNVKTAWGRGVCPG